MKCSNFSTSDLYSAPTSTFSEMSSYCPELFYFASECSQLVRPRMLVTFNSEAGAFFPLILLEFMEI